MILVCHATYVARPMRAIKPKPPGAALCPHDASEPNTHRRIKAASAASNSCCALTNSAKDSAVRSSIRCLAAALSNSPAAINLLRFSIRLDGFGVFARLVIFSRPPAPAPAAWRSSPPSAAPRRGSVAWPLNADRAHLLDLDQGDSRRKELAIFCPLRATSKRNAGGYHADSAIQLSFRLRNELRSYAGLRWKSCSFSLASFSVDTTNDPQQTDHFPRQPSYHGTWLGNRPVPTRRP